MISHNYMTYVYFFLMFSFSHDTWSRGVTVVLWTFGLGDFRCVRLFYLYFHTPFICPSPHVHMSLFHIELTLYRIERRTCCNNHITLSIMISWRSRQLIMRSPTQSSVDHTLLSSKGESFERNELMCNVGIFEVTNQKRKITSDGHQISDPHTILGLWCVWVGPTLTLWDVLQVTIEPLPKSSSGHLFLHLFD